MKRIHEATPIILTDAERTELEGLVRSTKTECRLRQRARIVVLAAEGTATRAIGRTTGTASKWRVRYAKWRLAGLDETGNRGSAPKYTPDAARRILRVLDLRPPDGYGRWTGPLIAKALGDVDPRLRGDKRAACLARAQSAEDRPCRAQKLVREQRS